MSLDTIISAGLPRAARPSHALVLMGGGARTAYQAGVLKALATMLDLQAGAGHRFPFPVLVGTSAGALNASFLAARATQGLTALVALAEFWGHIRSEHVYRVEASRWSRMSKYIAAWQLSRSAMQHSAVLDNTPLVDTLHRTIGLPDIEDALQRHAIDVLAVTASSYSSGVHWTFCQTRPTSPLRPWMRPGRRAEFQALTIEHLMASSAIPLLFPPTPLWVDGHAEYFGDGSMRQISPLSPAMHLQALKVLVIGVGQPQRSAFVSGGADNMARPGLGTIAGHAMASVFHDTLLADEEQAQRVNQTLQRLPPAVAAALPYKAVDVLAIQPSASLDALAQTHIGELPQATRAALGGMRNLGGGGAALASYLLFEPGFVGALMALGEQDAYARKDELLRFFS